MKVIREFAYRRIWVYFIIVFEILQPANICCFLNQKSLTLLFSQTLIIILVVLFFLNYNVALYFITLSLSLFLNNIVPPIEFS